MPRIEPVWLTKMRQRRPKWGLSAGDAEDLLEEIDRLMKERDGLEHKLVLARQVVDRIDQLIAGQQATNRLMADAHAPSAMLCEHANEVPQICPCRFLCYCKSHTCRLPGGAGDPA